MLFEKVISAWIYLGEVHDISGLHEVCDYLLILSLTWVPDL